MDELYWINRWATFFQSRGIQEELAREAAGVCFTFFVLIQGKKPGTLRPWILYLKWRDVQKLNWGLYRETLELSDLDAERLDSIEELYGLIEKFAGHADENMVKMVVYKKLQGIPLNLTEDVFLYRLGVDMGYIDIEEREPYKP